MQMKTWAEVATASVSIIKTPNRYEWSVIKSDGEVVATGSEWKFRFALDDANHALADYMNGQKDILGFDDEASKSTENTIWQVGVHEEIMDALMGLSIRRKK